MDWTPVCVSTLGAFLFGFCASALGQPPDGLGTPPPRSDYARRVIAAKDAATPSSPETHRQRVNIAGGWTLPGGGLVTFSNRQKGKNTDKYTVRMRVGGKDIVLEGTFDGKTLTTRRVPSKAESSPKRKRSVGVLGRLEGRHGDGELEGLEANDDPAEEQPAGTYTFRNEGDKLILTANSRVDPTGSTPTGFLERVARPDIVLLGMNEGSKHEAKNLRKNGTPVQRVGDSPAGDDKIRVGGETYDLTDPAQLRAFVNTLGLPPEQSEAVAAVIASGSLDSKDELAQLAQIWARAERGGTIPQRMVISGHHIGSAVWGDGNGDISWHTLGELAIAMPRAAEQIENLHVAACYSGGAAQLHTYKNIFPNLKTVWAYKGSAPGAYSGATGHMSSWERNTRGLLPNIYEGPAQLVNVNARKARNIYAANLDDPNLSSTATAEELVQIVEGGLDTFEDYLSGRREVQDSQTGELRSYYGQVQTALSHAGLDVLLHDEIVEIRDQAIRLLYYNSAVAPRFAREYGDRIQAGYRALGLRAPDFARLSRQEATAAIDRFRGLANTNSSAAVRDLLPLLNGLMNLDPEVIPEGWI